MNESWVTLLLLGIAAGFMPMVFGLEIYTLGEDDGVKKSSGLLGGITAFRLLIAFGVLLLFAGVMASLSQGLTDIGQFFGSLFSQLGKDITSGHHLLIDLMLVAGGILVIVQAISHVRRDTNSTSGSAASSTQSPQSADKASSSSVNSKALSVGVAGMIGLGLMLAVTNVNQWLFVSTAVNQILRMEAQPWTQLLAFILFMGVATVMIALPLLIFLIRPQQAQATLAKVNNWINGSMRYIFAGLLCLMGLYFIWRGGEGVMNFLASR